MPITYGSTHETLTYRDLEDQHLLSIGRLVRAFAGIEEVVSAYIAALARLTPSELLTLLGKAALRRRLDMAESLAKLAGNEEYARYCAAFPSEFFRALDIRNAVAHGVFIGVDSEGMLSFLTDKTDLPDGSTAIQIVLGVAPEELDRLSHSTQQNVEITAKLLRLRSSLQKHQQQVLRPHRKAQPRRKAGETPAPQPQPSQK